jgi:hypothetical protein
LCRQSISDIGLAEHRAIMLHNDGRPFSVLNDFAAKWGKKNFHVTPNAYCCGVGLCVTTCKISGPRGNWGRTYSLANAPDFLLVLLLVFLLLVFPGATRRRAAELGRTGSAE